MRLLLCVNLQHFRVNVTHVSAFLNNCSRLQYRPGSRLIQRRKEDGNDDEEEKEECIAGTRRLVEASNKKFTVRSKADRLQQQLQQSSSSAAGGAVGGGDKQGNARGAHVTSLPGSDKRPCPLCG